MQRTQRTQRPHTSAPRSLVVKERSLNGTIEFLSAHQSLTYQQRRTFNTRTNANASGHLNAANSIPRARKVPEHPNSWATTAPQLVRKTRTPTRTTRTRLLVHNPPRCAHAHARRARAMLSSAHHRSNARRQAGADGRWSLPVLSNGPRRASPRPHGGVCREHGPAALTPCCIRTGTPTKHVRRCGARARARREGACAAGELAPQASLRPGCAGV